VVAELSHAKYSLNSRKMMVSKTAKNVKADYNFVNYVPSQGQTQPKNLLLC
jgi:hypothetical protein